MITLNRQPQYHDGKSPILVFWDGVTAVFVDEANFLKKGHRLPNGTLIVSPVEFPNREAAIEVASHFTLPCVIKDRDEHRVNGVLRRLDANAGRLDFIPPAKITTRV